MTILVVKGIHIPPEYQKDLRMIQAYLKGHQDARVSTSTRVRRGRAAETQKCNQSRQNIPEQRQLSKRHNLIGPDGTYPRPKKPWEMTSEEYSAAERGCEEIRIQMGIYYVPNLPATFDPPPQQTFGGVYSFGDEPSETDSFSHMQRMRRKTNTFVPLEAFSKH